MGRRAVRCGIALAALAALVAGAAPVVAQLQQPSSLALKWGRGGGNDGLPGSAPGEFFDPERVAVDASDHVYVVDVLNHRIQKFDAAGAYIEEFGAFGSGPGQFSAPRGIALDDSTGEIYVVDSLNDRVQKFSADGTFLLEWGTSGSGDGQFHFPRDVALDGDGNVFVTDMDNHRVQKFDTSGAFLAAWGRFGSDDGEFLFPRGVGVDTRTGDVYVVDAFNHRVQHFTNDGVFVSKFGRNGGDGSFGVGDGEFNTPRGIVVSGADIWVADTGNDRIQHFTDEVFVEAIPDSLSEGPEDWQMHAPRGVALAVGFPGQYVADSGNHRVLLYGSPVLKGGAALAGGRAGAPARAAARSLPLEVEILPSRRDGRPARLLVRYQILQEAEVELEAAARDGRVLRVLERGRRRPGVHQAVGDLGVAGAGAPVVLVVRLRAGPAAVARAVALPGALTR